MCTTPKHKFTTQAGQLQTELQTAEDAEGAQQNAQAATLDATKVAQQTLGVAYDDASAVVNLMKGYWAKIMPWFVNCVNYGSSRFKLKNPVLV